jgi:hypothetical protein
VTPVKPQGKKVLVTPGAPYKAPAKKTLSAAPADNVEALLTDIMARGGLIEADPALAAMDAPGAHWGDLFMGPVASAPAEAETEERPLRGTYLEFWSQSFAANMEEHTADVYDTSRLTDEEWNAMMSWLYWKGWWIYTMERTWVEAVPDDLPARHWCPPPAGWGQNLSAELRGPPRAETPDPVDEADAKPKKVVRWSSQPSWEVLPAHSVRGDDDAPAASVLDHDHSAGCCAERRFPKKKALRVAGLAPVPVLRFCRAGADCAEKDTGCRYVHGDTIPKIDKPCGFGAECGASDPTGLKRSQCVYIHPGEEWTPDLCVRRP